MILVAILCGCGHVEADRGSDAAPLFDASPWDASGPDAGDATADAAVLFDAAPNPCDWPAYDGDACEGGLCRDGRCDGASCFVEGGLVRRRADRSPDGVPLLRCRDVDDLMAVAGRRHALHGRHLLGGRVRGMNPLHLLPSLGPRPAVERAVRILLDADLAVTESRVRVLVATAPRIGCDCGLCRNGGAGIEAHVRILVESWKKVDLEIFSR